MVEKLKILNFITDDKFLDTVMINHDSIKENVEHIYVIVIKTGHDKKSFRFQYIKNYQRIILLFKNEVIDFIKDHSINAIILHSLYSAPIDLIPKIDQAIPILWIAWGYDIYQIPDGKPLIDVPNLYLPTTYKYYTADLKKKRGLLKNNLAKIRDLFVEKGVYKTKQIRQIKSVIGRINFFSGIIDLEYKLMKRIPYFSAEESVYVYGPLNYEKTISYPKSRNILLGNSGNFTNNHLDILTILNKRGISDSQIITPMNYGGAENYVSAVTQFGKQLFGDNFKPLTKFLDRDAYNDLINSCSSVIIGTMRQQAMGNISLAFENGAKVFLFKDSILYKYLKNKGYKVFTIDDELTQDSISTPLLESDAIYNFKIHSELTSKKWNLRELEYIYTQFRQFISQTVDR